MDLASMAEELGLEEENVRQLILTFLDSTEQDLVLLARAFSGKDVEQVCAAAHHIKGAAGNLELHRIAEAARRIEEKARCGIIEDPTAPIKLIRSRLDSIRAQISSGE